MNAPLRKALRPSFRNRAWKAPEFTEADVDADASVEADTPVTDTEADVAADAEVDEPEA